jgi:hypothetical protein
MRYRFPLNCYNRVTSYEHFDGVLLTENPYQFAQTEYIIFDNGNNKNTEFLQK